MNALAQPHFGGRIRRSSQLAMLVWAIVLAAAVAMLAGSPAGAQANPFWGQLGADIDGENAGDFLSLIHI